MGRQLFAAMHKIVKEGSAVLKVHHTDVLSKRMEVFYNPVMELNRDISVLLLNSVNKSMMQIADPLAATGIRSLRFLRELNKNKIKKIYVNDNNKKAIKLIKENLRLNKKKYIDDRMIIIKNQDANLFLLNSAGFDYIDIDPFGTPNYFLDSACKRIARNGILAVTATDTSALCGTFPNACKRKYWALPKKGPLMHETGLRILIRKVQLVGAQYDKALAPVFSYSKEHYMRAFFINAKGKRIVDKILEQHGYFDDAGPMWLGCLWDKKLANSILKNALKNRKFNKNKELIRFLRVIKEESKINVVGFYDMHEILQKHKMGDLPKKEVLISKIREKGYEACNTHFKGEGIRSDISVKELFKILKGH